MNGDNAYDGTTPQTAKKTIQAAVNRAAKNDTVKVAEGVYADENAYDASTVACVVISNNLTLVATGAKESRIKVTLYRTREALRTFLEKEGYRI